MENFLDKILQFDQTSFFFINKTIKNRFLDWFFSFMTQLATPQAIISLCIVIFLCGRYRTKLISVFILFTCYVSYFVGETLKGIFNRPRPLEVYTEISVIGTAKSSAFPSIHSVLIAAVVTILCFKYRRLSFILIPIALVVAVSRVYLGHHYPSDLIAGLIIGSGISMLFLGVEGFVRSLQNL